MSFSTIKIVTLLQIIFYLFASNAKSENTVSRSNLLFTRNLYKAVANKEENIILSPFSVHNILSLLYQGASGHTAKIIEHFLLFKSPDLTAIEYKNLTKSLSNITNVTLDIANSIYITQRFKLKDNFKHVAYDSFGSEIKNIDFNDANRAAATINKCISEKTRNKITHLIQANDLNINTVMVLINVIYFKGKWALQFDPKLTQKEPFHVSKSRTIDCEMMHLKGEFKYAYSKDINAAIIMLPYQNKNMNLIIISPYVKGDLKNVEKKLKEKTDLSELLVELISTELVVSLPKFKIETTLNLEDPLKEIGLGIIFNDAAQFTNIAIKKSDIKVNKVVQRVMFEVNEEGAEAASAVAAVMMSRMGSIEFIVDHPFIFALVYQDNNVNTLLFLGKIYNPTSK